ncbi:CRISPR-associated endonuclease Cas1 [Alkalicaulis satelles]|uniref:CRISPR-associated endonuclease Cas1 n=1 Tax=Alkalicaulis satelles TaxID=2609175 RepID=A0A5M6ZNQ3_9PROT|nr:CRISPR-associated endonuclease Cas1 [Alkalicaulis satelles]KAA5805337.1 CRISPR-associated endonuclease Cas1 [Alkalicaulis satelles]
MLDSETLQESRADGDEWLERCQYWQAAHDAAMPTRKRRERQSAPLILTGHGLSIRVDRGALMIRDGLTHFPQERRAHRFFKGGLDIPPRIVIVDGSGEITLDALDWLETQDTPLIRLRWDGRIQSVTGKPQYASDPEKVARQRQTRANEAARTAFGANLIRQKIEGTLENLETCFPVSDLRGRAMACAEEALAILESSPPQTVSELIGLEGKVSRAYFRTWRTTPIRWKARDLNAVPQDWLTYQSRSALRAKKVPSNRRATHPVNAMLNYAYGMLEIRTRIAIIADGYDPTIGIVHGDMRTDRDTFVFDKMEPGRPEADRRVLKMIAEGSFSAADFTVSQMGTVKVSPELARLIAT